MVFPQSLHAFDNLHRFAGIGDGNAQILRRRVSRGKELGVPVLIDDAHFIHPEKLQVGILCRAEGSADAKQINHPRVPDQSHTAPDHNRIHQSLGVLQGHNVPVGYLFNDLLQGACVGNGALLIDFRLRLHSQLRRNGPAEIPVAGKTDMAAQTHDGGGGGKGHLRKIVNAQLRNQFRLFQDLGRHGFFRGAEGGYVFLQPKQGTCHEKGLRFFVEIVQKPMLFLNLFHKNCCDAMEKIKG